MLAAVCAALWVCASAGSVRGAEPAHAIAMHGDPAFAAGFSQFRYVNPDVRRGTRVAVAALALIVVLFVLSTRAVGQLPLMKRFTLR